MLTLSRSIAAARHKRKSVAVDHLFKQLPTYVIYRHMKYIFIASLLVLSFVSYAQAHGIGQSVEKQVGDYTIDIGYDSLTPEVPADAAVRFDFALWNKDKTEPVDFTTVWVRIAPLQGEGILFAGYLGQPDFGPTGISYVFARGGTYEVTARFTNKDKTLAETSFPLTVQNSAASQASNAPLSRNIWISGLAGLVIGASFSFLFRRKLSYVRVLTSK